MYQHKKGKKGSGVGQSDLIAELNIELNNLYAKISSTKRGTSNNLDRERRERPTPNQKCTQR